MTTVVVPWRDTGPRRATACRHVCDQLRTLLPGAPLLLTDSGHEPFNRAASRNAGIRHLPEDETVVVCDADLLLDPQALRAAIDSVQDGKLHYPFTLCWYLDQEHTERVLAGGPPEVGATTANLHGAQGGVMVMQAGAWRRVGGMDEEFTGWGYEDNAFCSTAGRTVGVHRHRGVIWHLDHPHERYTGSCAEQANYARAKTAEHG